jgi:hypothetical protein
MDLSKVDKYGLTHDLIKVTLFNILAHIAMHHGYNEPLLTYKFLFQLAFILLGFTGFYVFIEPHVRKYWTDADKAAKAAK